MRTEQITVIGSYPTSGSSPRGLSWDGERLWHVDEQLQCLFKLDAHTLHVLKLYPISGEPWGLEWDGRSLWLPDNRTKVIPQIEPLFGSTRYHERRATGITWFGCTRGCEHYRLGCQPALRIQRLRTPTV